MHFLSLRNRDLLGSFVLLVESIIGLRTRSRKLVGNPLQTDVPATVF